MFDLYNMFDPQGDTKSKIIAVVIVSIIMIIFALPIGVGAIVVGAIDPGNCDVVDTMGLSAGQYLIGLGVHICFMCVFVMTIFVLTMFWRSRIIKFVLTTITLVVHIVSAMFSIAWFVVGGIILFRANISCINHGAGTVILALVLWCLSAFGVIRSLLDVKNNTKKSLGK